MCEAVYAAHVLRNGKTHPAIPSLPWSPTHRASTFGAASKACLLWPLAHLVGHLPAYSTGMQTSPNPISTGHGAGIGYGMTVRKESEHCRFSERDGDTLLCRLKPTLRRYANRACEHWEREPGIEG
jgi:hypothetical protein